MQRKFVNAVILLGNKFCRHYCHRSIGNLMFTGQFNGVITAVNIACMQGKGLPVHRAFFFFTPKSAPVNIHRRLLKHAYGADRPNGVVARSRSNHRHFFFYNARLLHGNALYGSAELVAVVKRHIGNNAYHRRNYVSAVPQAAKPYFYNGIINFFQSKMQKSSRR